MSEMNEQETQKYVNQLHRSLSMTSGRIDWLALHRAAYDELIRIELELIDLIDLGILRNPVNLHTQGEPAFGGTLYLTEQQVGFDKTDGLWTCESSYCGIRATGKTKKQAYKNLCKKYKVTVFSKEEN